MNMRLQAEKLIHLTVLESGVFSRFWLTKYFFRMAFDKAGGIINLTIAFDTVLIIFCFQCLRALSNMHVLGKHNVGL